jgi:hypothetical protein
MTDPSLQGRGETPVELSALVVAGACQGPSVPEQLARLT